MTIGSRKASVLLLIGDVAAFSASLWLTLLFRYGAAPSELLLEAHGIPFATLFVLWVAVFFGNGLYEKRVIFSARDAARRIIRTQSINIVLAALFFFVVPGFGITPKTNLFIYLAVSLGLILLWRLVLFPRLSARRAPVRALMVGAGRDEEELAAELREERKYGIQCIASFDPSGADEQAFKSFLDAHAGSARLLIVDTKNPALAPFVPELYRRVFEERTYQVVDLLALYEEVFDRVPLSLVNYEWFFRYATKPPTHFYLVMKRLFDIAGGIGMLLVTLFAIVPVWIALSLEGSGPLFISQVRLGEWGTRIKVWKFRTMLRNDAASGQWVGEGENRITKVGAFLRQTSLDEFPQCLNVLAGDLSLVGPRNDIEGLGLRLAEALPYYRMRYVVRPGITGWAQVNQQYEQGNISPQSIAETKTRLAYDFYYLKHRSFVLDLVIALKTVKRMVFRVGGM